MNKLKKFCCKFCNFSTDKYKSLLKHYKEQHKQKQKLKTNLQELKKQVNIRLKKSGSKAYVYQEIRKLGTFHENIVKAILKQNNSFFEFQPLVFSTELGLNINPDFLVFSWKGKKLVTPFYLEIDGNNKDKNNDYQIKREISLKKKYPILRIWNENVNNRKVIYIIERFIEQTEENLKKIQKQEVINSLVSKNVLENLLRESENG